jgi:hypothetical protein
MLARARYSLALLLFVAITPVWAIEQMAIQIGFWSSEQIDITDLQVEINLQSTGLAVTATAKQVQLTEPVGQLSNVRLRCETLRWLSGQIDCQSGQLDFSHALWGNQKIAFNSKSRAEEENYQLTLTGIQLDQGSMDVQADYQQGQWQAELTGKNIALNSLVKFIGPYVNEKQLERLSQWNINAVINVDAELTGHQTRLTSAKVSGKLRDVMFADPTGSYAGEALAAQIQLALQIENDRWSWQQTLNIDKGQTYFEPIFLDLSEQSVTLSSEGEFNNANKTWQIRDIEFAQSTSISANGQLNGEAAQLTHLQMDLSSTDLAQLYKDWLQPFIPGSSLSHLQTSGELTASLQWQPEQYQFQMNLQSVTIVDDAGRFAIDNLEGILGWTNQASVIPIDLRWSSASILSLPLGGSTLQAEASQNQIQFSNLSLPILDGELSLNDFQLSLDEDQGNSWQFEGLLSPISMDQLSPLLGWPTLQGKLSGMIPKVSYANEEITVDGALLLKLFDATTVIKDLRLQQPFGSLPQLYANIDINRLDLQTLTNTFDFGNISGKLNGRIHNLRLSNWQPVQFDALFETPEEEPGRRRISQRAVNNLSQIGGGPAAILSRGFMGLFEDFSYSKIGLSCRLMNSICQMDGIETVEQGYYIVKGGGLPPWINVIGYNREVDWPELIARLKAVSQSDGPVIQ